MLLGGAGIGVSAQSAEPQAALRYAAYLCSAPIQAGAYAAHNGQPAHPAAWRHSEANHLTGSFLADTRTTIEAAYTRPRLAGWPEFQELLGDIIHECLSKDLAAEAAVELLETKHLAFIFNSTNLRNRSDAM